MKVTVVSEFLFFSTEKSVLLFTILHFLWVFFYYICYKSIFSEWKISLMSLSHEWFQAAYKDMKIRLR